MPHFYSVHIGDGIPDANGQYPRRNTQVPNACMLTVHSLLWFISVYISFLFQPLCFASSIEISLEDFSVFRSFSIALCNCSSVHRSFPSCLFPSTTSVNSPRAGC